MNKNRELDKLRILMNAVDSLQEEEPDFYAELKDAAWNVLHDNPGCGFDEWVQTLIEQYPTEVVDAFGSNPAETFQSLTDMWDTDFYEDEETGECHSFSQWSEFFATDKSVELYDLLVDAKREIKAHRATKI